MWSRAVLHDERYSVLRHVAFAALIFGSWEIYGQILDNPVLLPPVSSVAVAFVDITFGGPLLPALFESMRLLFVGFLAAFVFAFVFGLIIGRYKVMDRMLSPYFNALYALPTVALTPLILVWLGFGFTGRVVVVFLAAFFPILINVYTGARDTPDDLLEVARLFGLHKELDVMRRVVVPSAVPFILAGVRLGIGRAVVGMAIAEIFMRLSGIGTVIVQFGAVFKTNYVMAAIVALPLLGVGLTKFFAYFENRYQYWRPQ